MYKYITAFVVLVVIVLVGIYAYNTSNTSYVSALDSEVGQLETELGEVDALINEGELTPERAAEAEAKITARLNAINVAVDSASNEKLSEADRRILTEALGRLRDALKKYQSVLVAVDAAIEAGPGEDSGTARGRNGDRRSLAEVFAETVETVEEHVEEVTEASDEAAEGGHDGEENESDGSAMEEGQPEEQDGSADTGSEGEASGDEGSSAPEDKTGGQNEDGTEEDGTGPDTGDRATTTEPSGQENARDEGIQGSY